MHNSNISTPVIVYKRWVYFSFCVDTSKIAKTFDLANLKSDVNTIDIDKFKNVPITLSNLKSKADKVDLNKLEPVPVDLSKLSDVAKNSVAKKGKGKITSITSVTSYYCCSYCCWK